MIEDINLIGLPEETINDIEKKLGYDVILSFACNYKTVKANIELLKSFGLKNINDLILNRDYIFLLDTEQLVKKFSKFNFPVIANLINEDYSVIDEIFS